jgi:hypothetical protein
MMERNTTVVSLAEIRESRANSTGCCEICGNTTLSRAYFRGQEICGGCYFAQPRWLRDEVDASQFAEPRDTELCGSGDVG